MGQVARDAEHDSLLGLAIQRVLPGQQVRISTVDGWTLSGSYLSSDASYVLVEDRAERTVLRSQITELWAQTRATRRTARTAALVGALVGGAVGAYSGAVCAPECNVRGDSADVLRNGAIGMMVGGAAGWLLGSLIGGSTPSWEKLYP